MSEFDVLVSPCPLQLQSCPRYGILTGLIYGQVLCLQIYQLCTRSKDIDTKLILPLLKKTINNVCAYLSCMDDEQCFIAQAKEAASKQRVSSHLPHHPQLPLPPSAEVQRLWCQNFSTPPVEPQLHQLRNAEGVHIPVRQFIVTYRHDLNLDNICSYRNPCQCKGPKVLSHVSTSTGK